ncbi:hypothetical protein SteCoe_4959 [Stentor coeruleus]|uniref:CD36 family protein n=1 Tax=Stentor coeruleus TaxID=5963 RepID=A0A1R2CTF7_9CILI|nr:hypothetical protein SteCoe_4959 [Stentor coeruleus]
MIKKPWVIGCCLALWAISFLLLAVLTPIILSNLLEEKIKESVKLTNSNGKKLWGELPGDKECIMYQKFNMFNLLNPDGVLLGEPPELEEKSGYLYQEYDNFLNIDHEKYENNDVVRYNLLRYEKVTHNTEWPETITPEDQITSLSIGTFSIWDQLKHQSRQQLSLTTLYTLIRQLETSLPLSIYSSALNSLINTYEIADSNIYQPANISESLAQALWSDVNYGMKNVNGLQIWIQALSENTINGNFVLTSPITGNLYILWQYFGLTYNQMFMLFTGYFNTAYVNVTYMAYNHYGCKPNKYSQELCDPVYLSALQWTQSYITRFPLLINESYQSISSFNTTFQGYPEMYYFYTATPTRAKYHNVNFTIESYESLFYYNRTTGFPAYSESTLLDVGKMTQFFDLAYEGRFLELVEILRLPSLNHTRVLWDYINSLVDLTVLKGRYDPNVYNIDNRGISSEAAIGNIGSQCLYKLITDMAEIIPIVITSGYDLFQLHTDKIYCVSVVAEILSDDETYICGNYALEWSISSNGISLWILAYWNGVNSTDWNNFQQISMLNYTNMLKLFNTSNILTQTFASYDLYLKKHYGCSNPGLRCDPMYLAKMQWGRGLVTMNLPSAFSKGYIGNSTSITNFEFLSMGLNGTPEYYSFSKGLLTPILTESEIDFLLSFNGLFSSSQFQLFFIYQYEGNHNLQQESFKLPKNNYMIEYLRHLIDKYYFGGLIKTKSVSTILWNDTEPLLQSLKSLNPLLGGNPALDPSLTSIGRNMSKNSVASLPKYMKNMMDSGETHVKNVRKYRLFAGKDYINFPVLGYFGQLPNNTGPNLTYYNMNPWGANISIEGTDAWGFKPYISKSDDINIFFDIGSLVFEGKYDKQVTVKNFDCYRYRINNDILKNSTAIEKNKALYAFGPSGLINETMVFGAPVFGSKPYFLDADTILLKLVNFSDFASVHIHDYDTFFDVEKYSGTVFYSIEQFQYNFELKPDNLYPKLGLYNMKRYGRRTYMPFFYMQRYQKLSQHIVDKYFGIIHTILTVSLIAQIVGFTLSGILLVLLIIYIWVRRRKVRIALESEKGYSLLIK